MYMSSLSFNRVGYIEAAKNTKKYIRCLILSNKNGPRSTSCRTYQGTDPGRLVDFLGTAFETLFVEDVVEKAPRHFFRWCLKAATWFVVMQQNPHSSARCVKPCEAWKSAILVESPNSGKTSDAVISWNRLKCLMIFELIFGTVIWQILLKDSLSGYSKTVDIELLW